METDMNKIPLAAAIALVLTSSLAFASNTKLPPQTLATTEHCSYLEMQHPIQDAKSYSAAKKQVAEQNAMGLCRQDKQDNAS
jgi:hypothetical protein